MKVIVVYTDENSIDSVKNAMFNAGGGVVGNYDKCCFQTKGIGQFRPLSNSNPHIGTYNQVEEVSEIKLEMACSDEKLSDVLAAMIKAHPYETPAYHVINSYE